MSYPYSFLIEVTENNKRPIAMVIIAQNDTDAIILAQSNLPRGYTSQADILIKGSCKVDQIGNCIVVIL